MMPGGSKAIFAVLLLAVFISILFLCQPDAKLAEVCFSANCVMAEGADTPAKRAQGLMFRDALGENEGMLFVFDADGFYGFWMKNTNIPLDIIWLDRNFTVVHIESAAPCPGDACESYTSGQPARYVVELNTGFAEQRCIKVGDSANITV